MAQKSRDDFELFSLLKTRLFTAVVGDTLDVLGFDRQFLPPHIKPLSDEMIVAGRAMPVLAADISETSPKVSKGADRPAFGLMLKALDDLKPGEVYVCAGASPRFALWGEIMATRAQRLGSAGAVLDGFCRDSRGILRLNFATFCSGRYAQDQRYRGEIVDFRLELVIGGVRVAPGDLVFGDLEGVLVIPRRVEQDVIEESLVRLEKERQVKDAITNRNVSSEEAFNTLGVF